MLINWTVMWVGRIVSATTTQPHLQWHTWHPLPVLLLSLSVIMWLLEEVEKTSSIYWRWHHQRITLHHHLFVEITLQLSKLASLCRSQWNQPCYHTHTRTHTHMRTCIHTQRHTHVCMHTCNQFLYNNTFTIIIYYIPVTTLILVVVQLCWYLNFIL